MAKNLSQIKDSDLSAEVDQKEYNTYLINKTMSFHIESLFDANIMNQFPDLPTKANHDYYKHVLPKKKRFFKWQKRKNNSDIEMISIWYQCNRERAKEALLILSKEDIEELKKIFEGRK